MKLYLGLILVFIVTCNQIEQEGEEREVLLSLSGKWKKLKECLPEETRANEKIRELFNHVKKKRFSKANELAKELNVLDLDGYKDCYNLYFKDRDLTLAFPRKNKPRFHPCAKICKKQLNITWDEAKNSTELKECVEKCKEEMKTKQEERKKKCLEECEKLKETQTQDETVVKTRLSPYFKCTLKCRRPKPHWRKPKWRKPIQGKGHF